MSKQDLTPERLRELLHYDLETGIFTRLVNVKGGAKAGDIAGAIKSRGYLYIGIDGKGYRAARLAFFYVNEYWPAGVIDHIDGNRLNNAFSNLRDVSQKHNVHNVRRPRSDGTSGFLGVTRFGNKYRAQISYDGKNRHLGCYDTPEEAHAAYISAKREHHQGNTL